MRVGLFITCLGDTLFPETGRATVAILERLGHTRSRSGAAAAISVSVPEVRWTDALVAQATEAVQATARKISERMGYEDTGARSADD